MPDPMKQYSVVQINPMAFEVAEEYRGLYAVVNEIRPAYLHAYIPTPTGLIWLRLLASQVAKVGQAAWIAHEDSDENNTPDLDVPPTGNPT